MNSMIFQFMILNWAFAAFIITMIGLILPCDSKHQMKVIKDDPIFLAQAKELLKRLNEEYEQSQHQNSINAWNLESNLQRRNIPPEYSYKMKKYHTNHAEKNTIDMTTKNDTAKGNNIFGVVDNFPWHNISDYDVRRQFQKFSDFYYRMSSKSKYIQFDNLISEMEKIYSTTKIGSYTMPTQYNLALEHEITEIMIKSHDPDELKYIWKAWHDAAGKSVKNHYIEYVKYGKKIARMNNYNDMSAMWLSEYETPNFFEVIDSLWHEIEPLYHQLHTYVRRQLRHKYGDDIVSKQGPTPAHLFGNMWAQSWTNIANFTMPYPKKKFPDITNIMIKQNWNEMKIFREAESFFVSLNLSPMPKLFWRNSILKKPKDRDIVCHPSAWDFHDGKDYRIMQCTRINMEDLLTAYHEMGHIEYYIQYRNQPAIYRIGSNPGFHEAIGDTISLSASTLTNFNKIGLLHHITNDRETIINHLYTTALERLPTLAFAYALEKWRYDVFQSKVSSDKYNCHWWDVIEKYQGMAPPVERSESSFDPGGKYHIIADVEYMRYFISTIIQFQFHKSLCIEAKKYDPSNPWSHLMSECNIRGSKKAGKLLQSMLAMGGSRPWPDAMEKITGQRNINASALLEYFMPLTQWLESENKKHHEFIGWKRNHRCKYQLYIVCLVTFTYVYYRKKF